MPDKKIFKKNINKTLIELEIQTKDFAKLINPFLLRDIKDSSKARIYNELLLLINDYSIDCVDIFKWTYTDKVESKKHRKQLLNKKKKIIQSLDSLRPKEATKVSAHIYIKVCRFAPNLLIEFVNEIWNKLKDIYENLEQNPRYRLKSDSRKEKAVELFIENEILDYYKLFLYFNKRYTGMKPFWKNSKKIEEIEVRDVFSRSYSYPQVALKIISEYADCDYSALEEIRTDFSKKSKINL